MSKKDNLKPCRTKKEARERGKNGGIKSGESRRMQKTLKELLTTLMDSKTSDKNSVELQKQGFKKNECTNKALYVAGLFQNAMKGNAKAIEMIDKLMGETERQDGQDNKQIAITFEDTSDDNS